MGSFPNIIFGAYGDEKATSSTKVHGHELGQLMVLPDGRKYRYAKSGGTALAVGTILREGAMQALMDNNLDYAQQLNQEASQLKNHVDFYNVQCLIDYKRNNQEAFFENLKLAGEIGLEGSRYAQYVIAITNKLKSAQ